MVSLEVYEGWASKIVSISHFIHIHSEYNTDFGESAVGDKCQQLIFLIRCINQTDAGNVYLGTSAAFNEGGILTRI